MVIKVRTIFLSFAFCFIWNLSFYGQSDFPPPPDSTVQSTQFYDCDGEDTGGGDPSVPPGLCMPIDDYILPLFVIGLIFGAYKMRKLEKI